MASLQLAQNLEKEINLRLNQIKMLTMMERVKTLNWEEMSEVLTDFVKENPVYEMIFLLMYRETLSVLY
jgi:hypothetical protein